MAPQLEMNIDDLNEALALARSLRDFEVDGGVKGEHGQDPKEFVNTQTGILTYLSGWGLSFNHKTRKWTRREFAPQEARES